MSSKVGVKAMCLVCDGTGLEPLNKPGLCQICDACDGEGFTTITYIAFDKRKDDATQTHVVIGFGAMGTHVKKQEWARGDYEG